MGIRRVLGRSTSPAGSGRGNERQLRTSPHQRDLRPALLSLWLHPRCHIVRRPVLLRSVPQRHTEARRRIPVRDALRRRRNTGLWWRLGPELLQPGRPSSGLGADRQRATEPRGAGSAYGAKLGCWGRRGGGRDSAGHDIPDFGCGLEPAPGPIWTVYATVQGSLTKRCWSELWRLVWIRYKSTVRGWRQWPESMLQDYFTLCQ